MSWSGGKDCALALYELTMEPRFNVVALLTTVSEEFRRVSHHGVREDLLDAQSEAMGLPLTKVYLPSSKHAPCTNAVYEEIMASVMADFRSRGVLAVGFGDIFLEDLRAWRETNLAKAGMTGVFPIWGRDTRQVAKQLIVMGFKAILACAEGKVGLGFAGRAYDARLLEDLPAGIDPCGEHGEFHTFVHNGPCFRCPVRVRIGEIVTRDGRHYADLHCAESASSLVCAAADIPPV
jgi:uncharacterized protein (TIGR00290 family)